LDPFFHYSCAGCVCFYLPWNQAAVPAEISPETSLSLTAMPTETPLPENYPKLPREYFENENETDGIILGGTVLVLIILIGTLVFIRNTYQNKRNEK
jgi:hypothetical protein